MKTNSKESCGVCNKFIYLHDKILICARDKKSYHAKCLKIDNDTATELQNDSDWFCPLCLSDIFPCFNENNNNILPEISKCNSCSKIISKSRHKIAHCLKCNLISHNYCLDAFLCKTCCQNVKPDSVICTKHFDPYNIDDDDEHDYFFDDEIDQSFNTVQIVKEVLNNCTYYPSDTLPITKLLNTTFYFHNIDGFKSNFNEFLGNKMIYKHDFDFYCFSETNIHDNCKENFDIEGYTPEYLYAIEGKAKGSGLALYFRDTLPFIKISKY